MKYLVFDTETTGKALFNHSPLDPKQPFIVQLAAVLYEEGNEVKAINHIVKPNGWTISDEVAAIHGITQAMAEAQGVDLVHAILDFSSLLTQADVLIAHNLQFDMILLLASMKRCELEAVRLPKRFCTMTAMTDICKLRGPFRGAYKWPKLTEAYHHCFNETFDGAHDALVDVRACGRVYCWLREKGLHQP